MDMDGSVQEEGESELSDSSESEAQGLLKRSAVMDDDDDTKRNRDLLKKLEGA